MYCQESYFPKGGKCRIQWQDKKQGLKDRHQSNGIVGPLHDHSESNLILASCIFLPLNHRFQEQVFKIVLATPIECSGILTVTLRICGIFVQSYISQSCPLSKFRNQKCP